MRYATYKQVQFLMRHGRMTRTLAVTTDRKTAAELITKIMAKWEPERKRVTVPISL